MDRIPCPLCSTTATMSPIGESCFSGRCKRCKADLAVAVTSIGITVAVHEGEGESDAVPLMFSIRKDSQTAADNRQPVAFVVLKQARKIAAGGRRAS